MLWASLESSKVGSKAMKARKFKILHASGIICAMMALAVVATMARNLTWDQPIHECRIGESKQVMRLSRKEHPARAGKATNYLGKNGKQTQDNNARVNNSKMAAARRELRTRGPGSRAPEAGKSRKCKKERDIAQDGGTRAPVDSKAGRDALRARMAEKFGGGGAGRIADTTSIWRWQQLAASPARQEIWRWRRWLHRQHDEKFGGGGAGCIVGTTRNLAMAALATLPAQQEIWRWRR